MSLSLHYHKNSNFFRSNYSGKMGKARVTSHAGRELFFTFPALSLSEGAFGLYLIYKIITFDRNERETLFFY